VLSYAQTEQTIAQALQDGDGPGAERLAHTLKGVAGNLGATSLAQSAGVLESALREGQAAHLRQSALRDTGRVLEQLLSALRPVLAQLSPDPQPASRPWSEAQLQAGAQALQTIIQLLQQDDPAAHDVWNTHRPVLHTLVQQAAQVEAAIENFAFENALVLLQASTAHGSGA
jgi:two-component system sensor histidine kinase/response regulator